MASICPRLLTSGTCPDSSCTLLHNVQFCDLCGVNITSPKDRVAHFRGRRHYQRLFSQFLYCNICETGIRAHKWDTHTSHPMHVQAAQVKGVSPLITSGDRVVTDLEGRKYCDLCQIHIANANWNDHVRGRNHKRMEKLSAFNAVLDEAERDKNGITIEGSFDFDIITPTVSSVGMSVTPIIKMAIPHSRATLVEVNLMSAKGGSPTSSFTVMVDGSTCKVSYGNPLRLKVTFRQSHIGRYQDRAEFLFEDPQLQKRFLISRTLRAIVGSRADHQLLRPKAPYVPREQLARQPEVTVVEGVDPPSLKAIPYVFKLPKADIPRALLSTLSSSTGYSECIKRVKNVFLPSTLEGDTYARHFKHLLWIEECQMDRDMERYDMPNVTLTRHERYYYLQVPGLAEKRPSVLVGDRILVQKQGETQGHWFEGRVHVLRKEEVGLRFHGSFGWSAAQRYNVRFKLNRIPMRRQHQAMDSVFAQVRVLFPSENQMPRTPYTRTRLQLVNPLLATNTPQCQAVNAIMHQTPGSVPFVIFGPPGTGKTITMIEAIQQVLRNNPRAKILACAPSNSAADLLALRLGALSTEELFRIYAPSRFKSQVPDELLAYTYIRQDGHFSVPPLARMKRFRVVVTTCISASIVSGIGIPRGHYSHIFVDEAGQATEPEAFVSIKTMADNSTNIVLSGDPKQLGPIIRSGIARELGLEKSYIERLMATKVYDVHTGHGLSVIKLTKNYRSHDSILKFPNENFYDGDLEPCGDPNVITKFLGSSYLPAKTFPVVFHGISGKDDREASSPSFFNIDEVTQVKTYVQALRADRRFRTTENDIGIITPYNAQCLKIRAVLKAVAEGIKVGSVEEFQGQERRVIIISTVRSSKEFVEYDLRHTLGFVANPRRFNVAVTRAQALLIIVGDPQVLSLDPLWRSFLNYIYENKGWTGVPITWDPRTPVQQEGNYDRAIREAAEVDMNDFARRMEALTLGGVDGAGDDEGNVDRPWRDVE